MANEQFFDITRSYRPIEGKSPFTRWRADIELPTDRREARRLPILTEREAAILILGKKQLHVRLLDESAYGLSFRVEGKHGIDPGRKLEMITVAGRFEVLVIRAEGDGDETRIGVRILREVAPPASSRLSSVALFLVVLLATVVLMRTITVMRRMPLPLLPSPQAPVAEQPQLKQQPLPPQQPPPPQHGPPTGAAAPTTAREWQR